MGRAEAQSGYNDDLVISFGTAMYMRDTAFKFKQHGIDLTKSMLGSIATNRTSFDGVYVPGPNNTNQQINEHNNPYQIDNPYSNGKEDIKWLL